MADHSQKSASAVHSFSHKAKTDYEAIIAVSADFYIPVVATIEQKPSLIFVCFYCILYLLEFPQGLQ
jgi:hypothetical protein